MEMRKVGSLEVSVAGVGGNNFGQRLDADATAAVVAAALEVGVNHFDTADTYGHGRSEEFLGQALRDHRADVVITTKVGFGTPPEGLTGGRPEWILPSCDGSLARLGTDVIDLYLLHRYDNETPIADTLGALNELVEAGKVREIGCSNFTAEQLAEAASAVRDNGLRPLVNAQHKYSLLSRDVEADVLPACALLGMSVTPYHPLERGLLTGKYRRGESPAEGTRLAEWGDRASEVMSDAWMTWVERLESYAEAHGHTVLELALSWLAGRPGVSSVIAGATTPAQVRANVAATAAWSLTIEERAEVDELTMA